MTHPPSSAATAATVDPAAQGSAAPPTGAATTATSARAGQLPRPGWLEMLRSIGRDLPGLVGDRVDLLALELQRAGQALAQILALLVAATILGVTAWLALWTGIGIGLVELGLHWSLTLLLLLALNTGVAWLAVARLRLLLPLLRLPATRRHLVPGGPGTQPAPATPPMPGPGMPATARPGRAA